MNRVDLSGFFPINPPEKFVLQNDCLTIITDPETDFWQQTHYGFRADNGHFLYLKVAGDFSVTTRVRFHPAHLYDQAGLMVRVGPSCWIKTSVEYLLFVVMNSVNTSCLVCVRKTLVR